MLPRPRETLDRDCTHKSHFSDYCRNLSDNEREAEKRRYSQESYSNVRILSDLSRECICLQARGMEASMSLSQKGKDCDKCDGIQTRASLLP